MSKKGVTIITLAIIIVVMSILSGVMVRFGINVHNSSKMAKFQAEIDQIEILTANYIKRNSGNDFVAYTWDISSLSAYGSNQFDGERIIDGKIETYIVDLIKIDASEVHKGLAQEGATDRYLYSEQTGHVYYEKGMMLGDKTYYRISELEE